MKKILSLLVMVTIVSLSISAISADKVVVIPLNYSSNQTGCPNGLTECSGNCVDAAHNPENCGECNSVCATNEYCENGECVSKILKCDDGNACTDDNYNPQSGECSFIPNDAAPCDDGNLCTLNDACSDGVCRGDALDCNDDDPCTSDSCNPSGIGCVYTVEVDGTPCDDGNLCTQGEECVSGVCGQGTPLSCDDGMFCNGPEGCDPASGCFPTGDPCNGPDGDGDCSESCNESGDHCTAPDPDSAPCDDGNLCTQSEECVSGVCGQGTPLSCDDGMFCNGPEGCDPASGCFPTGDPCNGPDGDGDCSESCNESDDHCTAPDPDNAPCDDGNPSTSGDVCTAGACTGIPD
jgi:Stigma-specific protein, Stig1